MRIVATNLGKRFNREWVFRNFNYQFEPGKSYAVTGPNGSGKSTLMQVLWGQMHPSEGSVNYPIKDQAEIYKSISIAAPYMDLIEEYTLEEMVNFHFKFKRCRYDLKEALERIELTSSNQKIISSFSSGMRQRVKLALAFFSQADLLFLDEPCTNLDRKSIEWYTSNLALVSTSATILIASNSEHEYPFTSDRIDILNYK